MLSYTKGFQILVYGRFNKTVNILSQVNGTFEFKFKYVIGEEILSLIVDQSGLYYHAITFNNKLYIFYHCSTGCSSCSFPNNCSVCEDGYILKGAYCFPKPTQCVRNVILKGNVCE